MPIYRTIMWTASAAAMFGPLVFFAGSIWGGMDPGFAGHLTAIVVLAGLLTICFSPLLGTEDDGLGTSRARWDKIATVWLYTSGVVHLTWELSWCIAHPYLHDISAQDTWAWIWWVYGVADGRYLNSDSFIVPMEWVTSVVGGPLAIYAAILLKRGKLIQANLMVIILSAMEGYGTILYWGTEWAAGWASTDPDHVVNWYVKFWGLNAVWVLLPTISVAVSWRALVEELTGGGGPDAEASTAP